MTNETEQIRPLSLHERYSVARRNSTFPAVVVVAVAYPSSSVLPSQPSLENRIIELQRHFPLLYSSVEGVRTTKPYFKSRDEIWSPSEILFSTTYMPKADAKEELAEVFGEEPYVLGRKQDFWSGPAWQVRMHTHPESESSRAYLTLAIDHIYNDGRGLLALLEFLLADDISSLPYEKLSEIPRVEDTISMKPTMGYFLPIVFDKLLLPKLPNFIQPYFKKPTPWPSTVIRQSPVDCPPAQTLISLPLDLITNLKLVSKEHGIKTLHGLLKAAFMVSVWSVYRYTLTPFIVRGSTPRSERTSTLGHALCTGNYVSSHKVDIPMDGKDDFWVIAKKVADELIDPQAMQTGRMDMGMLAWVPDGEFDPPHEDPRRVTKWEDFFLSGAYSPAPFNESVSFSNLGVTKLPKGADDLIWGQEASPYAPPFNASVIGHEGGLRMIVVWKEGSAVIKEEVEQLKKVFEGVLRKLVEGVDNTTLEVLTKV
ncbi:hypothetical protein I302_106979 [Kwoniella bestiolae CBS 10118]|uniref:Alcohol acetyltransferase n=1 Tax=Kwoniella bestiolae CBS 10118 TaxID=1296100 RepID=A0A1B9FZV1_9TREE|nr:hypothetical protein I302_05757 [Kwoniella bestiolae CBS 10118]OCF24298.1 hypothetical protein I302_05757 [Kwoniella bestiolae CBS 10118]